MADKKAIRTGEEKEMNLARQQSMKRFEDLYADPPPYSSQPPSAQASTSSVGAGSAPLPSVAATEELNFQPSPLEIPTPAECIAHLKLLHAFARLRRDIGNRDGLFGISMGKMGESGQVSNSNGELSSTKDENKSGQQHEQDAAVAVAGSHAQENTAAADAALAERIRDKRWTVFVAKAVARYERWWDQHANTSSEWSYPPIKKRDFEASTYGCLDDKPRSKFLHFLSHLACSRSHSQQIHH